MFAAISRSPTFASFRDVCSSTSAGLWSPRNDA
jgi:hypothetical protein